MNSRAPSSAAVGRQNAYVSDTAEVVEAINGMAATLAPELLPNGRRAGNKWMFSGIPDTGHSESAWLHLSGPKIGRWTDAGNCAAGEEKGDMIDLIRLKLGLTERDAFEEARRRLGYPTGGQRAQLSQAEKQRRAEEARARAEERERAEQAERESKAKSAKALFLSGRPIAGTGAEEYLRGRGIGTGPLGDWPGSLRFADLIWHVPSKRKHPAMLACVYHADGSFFGTHRIYLERFLTGWRGIAVPEGLTKKERKGYRKRILGNQWGGFIPINQGKSGKSMAVMPEGEPVYVCEGPEDALAIRMIKPEARIICSINLGNIGAIVLPRQAGPLVIVADRDTDEDGEDNLAGLERVIAQQQARGQQCQLVLPPAEVGGRKIKDINDWVLALTQAPKGAAA